MITSRRTFITGLISFVAAPAIVRAGSLMPIKQMPIEILLPPYGWSPVLSEAYNWINIDKLAEQIFKAYEIPPELLR